MKAEELVDVAEREGKAIAIQKEAGTVAIQRVMDGCDLISSSLRGRNNVIGDVSTEVGYLHDKIRIIIERIATTIENEKYKPSEEVIMTDRSISCKTRERANALLNADKKCLISCQSLNIAIEIFSDLNKLIKLQIEESEKIGDTQLEKNLLLSNAILVYELTDFAINYIKTFKIQGVEDITRLYNETCRRNAEIISELEQLKRDAQKDGIKPSTRDITLADITRREEAIKIINKEWDKYVQRNTKLQEEVDSVGCNLQNLCLIRDNAKNQINVLEAVAVLQIR